MNIKFLLFLPVLISCKYNIENSRTSPINQEITKTDSSYIWTKVLDHADWKESYNFQLISLNNLLYAFHPDGTWQSEDGKNWLKLALPNAINNHAFLDYVIFNGAVYGMGYFKGNIENFEFKPEIYKTTDLKKWTLLSEKSNLPKRFFYHPFVFENKIWILGGEDQHTKYSDIWNSEDGVQWIKQKQNLPFGKRSESQIVQLNNILYLLNNDVWSSTDGLNWKKIADEIVSGEQIFGYTAQVFDNKIWLIGCNRNGQFTSQVLFSTDGINWHDHRAPWLPRGGIAATVHNNKIYMTGGKYGGTPNHPEFRYDNDVWALEKSK